MDSKEEIKAIKEDSLIQQIGFSISILRLYFVFIPVVIIASISIGKIEPLIGLISFPLIMQKLYFEKYLPLKKKYKLKNIWFISEKQIKEIAINESKSNKYK